MAYIVMAYIAMGYIAMACTAMASVVMACTARQHGWGDGSAGQELHPTDGTRNYTELKKKGSPQGSVAARAVRGRGCGATWFARWEPCILESHGCIGHDCIGHDYMRLFESGLTSLLRFVGSSLTQYLCAYQGWEIPRPARSTEHRISIRRTSRRRRVRSHVYRGVQPCAGTYA